MTIHTLEEFFTPWSIETRKTLQLLQCISDDSLAKELHPDVRTIGRLVWHIVQTMPEMMERTGLTVEGPEYDSPPPKTAKELVEAYEKTAGALAKAIEDNWKTDESLQETDDMYGMEWTRAQTLEALIGHEIHHRGQLTVLMRLAELPVPGTYGPSRDEWAGYGMPTPQV